nr:ribonuclease H-like domain, reverse transcriptase, RNA-dependent DNA polymerase [Tanacetum cinerariifolium]
MSYLSDFEELNGRYVAFGGNSKGGKISGKGKIKTGKLDFDDVYFVKEFKFNLFSVSQMCDKKNSVLFTNTKCLILSPEFKLLDKNQVLLKVPRENNMYNVNLKNIVPSGDLTCLFAKPIIDESNLWHRRLGHINFKTMNKLVKGKFNGKVDEGFLVGYSVSSKAFRVFNSKTRIIKETLQVNFLENKPNDAEKAREENEQQYVLFLVWSSGSTNPQNTNGDVAFDEKDPEFEGRKPGSEVNVSPSSSAQLKKHDDKTEREAKGKSPVESLIGYRNLSAKFEDFSDNSINEVNVAGTIVPATGHFSYPDDPNMPELEDITYFDDEDDVGAEADFNNLETSITVSPILTTRVHKDHPVTQIIGDLSSATQIRSMIRVAKDQGVKSAFLYVTIEEEVYVCQPLGFVDSDYLDKVYKVVKALYGLHQALRAWYETLANYLLENDFQRGKIDQTLFIKRQKGNILLVQIYVDDIIFGSTNKDLCKAFEKLMKDKFHMSSMGELTFFLGLQVKQKKDGIFISQDKYVAEILRKFRLTDGKSASCLY